MRVEIKAALLLFACWLISCREDKPAETDAEIRYRYFNMEQVGWKSLQNKQKISDIYYTATEVPLPYYILKNEGTENLFKVDSIYQASKRERIIEFEFEHDKSEDLLDQSHTGLDYQKSVQYMAFTIEKDFYIVTSSNDTLKCSGVTFERNFKLAKNNKVLLFFTDVNPEDKIQLVYNDNLFKNGIIKFKFNENITKLVL